MTIQTFIEKAIEGGYVFQKETTYVWMGQTERVNASCIFLNPEAWKAVGEVEGWDEIEDSHDFWRFRMHRMIDSLAEGKTIEQFLETL